MDSELKKWVESDCDGLIKYDDIKPIYDRDMCLPVCPGPDGDPCPNSHNECGYDKGAVCMAYCQRIAEQFGEYMAEKFGKGIGVK